MPMLIADKLQAVKATLPQGVELVAVSKYHPVEDIKEAYRAGQRVFGENIVQELRVKQPVMPDDVEWHFIGHLQTNKIKYEVPKIEPVNKQN